MLVQLREAAKRSDEKPDFHPSVGDASVYRRRAVSILLPKEAPWLDAVHEHIVDRGPIRAKALSATEA